MSPLYGGFSSPKAANFWTQRAEPGRICGAGVHADHCNALRAICARRGLDYFGIDCAIDNRGDLLVFEVNASMLAHEDNAEFSLQGPRRSRDQAGLRPHAGEPRAVPAAVSDATPLSP